MRMTRDSSFAALPLAFAVPILHEPVAYMSWPVQLVGYSKMYNPHKDGWLCGSVVELWSLAGALSLPCA